MSLFIFTYCLLNYVDSYWQISNYSLLLYKYEINQIIRKVLNVEHVSKAV